MNKLTMLALAGASLIAAATAAAPSLAQEKTLTISWWGFNGEKLDQFVVKPFEAKCGCKLVFETGNNADRLNKIKIRNGEGVDVAYFTDAYSQIGIGDRPVPDVDRSKLPESRRHL